MSEQEAAPAEDTEIQDEPKAEEAPAPAEEESKDTAAEKAAKEILDRVGQDDDEDPEKIEGTGGLPGKDAEEDDDVEDLDADAEDDDEEVDDEEDESDANEPDLPDALLERAIRAGVTISEAKELGSKGLEMVLGRLDPDGASDEGAPDGEVKPLELPELDPEEYDEEVLKVVQARDEVIKEMHERLEKSDRQLREFQDTIHYQEEERFWDQVDDSFASLGKGWERVVGSGDRHSLEESSAEYNNRVKIAEEMDTLLEIDAKKGRKTPVPELVRKAASLAFPKQEKKIVDARRKATQRKRDNAKVNRPSGDRDHPQDPDASAANVVRRLLDEKGIDY